MGILNSRCKTFCYEYIFNEYLNKIYTPEVISMARKLFNLFLLFQLAKKKFKSQNYGAKIQHTIIIIYTVIIHQWSR
jgi:hypothetical protein